MALADAPRGLSASGAGGGGRGRAGWVPKTPTRCPPSSGGGASDPAPTTTQPHPPTTPAGRAGGRTRYRRFRGGARPVPWPDHRAGRRRPRPLRLSDRAGSGQGGSRLRAAHARAVAGGSAHRRGGKFDGRCRRVPGHAGRGCGGGGRGEGGEGGGGVGRGGPSPSPRPPFALPIRNRALRGNSRPPVPAGKRRAPPRTARTLSIHAQNTHARLPRPKRAPSATRPSPCPSTLCRSA